MDRILLLCCRSCLRGDGDNNEYYEVLGLHDKSANQETIKKAFKKTSLNLHPDKLAQRGIEVTAENKQMFLKVRLFTGVQRNFRLTGVLRKHLIRC